MDSAYLLILIAGAFSGGFINGLAGFGTSLFALGWWLQIMPPQQAVALALVLSVCTSLQGVAAVRGAIDWRRLSRFLVPALIGIPIGLRLLAHIDPVVLRIMIAGFMLLYGAFFYWRRNLPGLRRRTPVIDMGVGFIGGVLGAIAGLSGALPTMWISFRDWTKMQSRAVLQPFNLVVLGVAALLLAVDGVYDRAVMIGLAIVLPVGVLAAWIGLRVFARLGDRQFRHLLVAMTSVAGAAILLQELI